MKEGKRTKQAFRSLVYDKKRDILKEIETGDLMIAFPDITEGVKAYLKTDEDPVREVRKCYRERLGKNCPRTVTDWLRGTAPSTKNRRNNFDLCMALGMNLTEMKNFFEKYYRSEAFNFKNSVDAVYAYAVLHGLPYTFVEDTLERLKTCDKRTAGETCTEEIEERIFEMTDSEEFLSYMEGHCYDRRMFRARARREILMLMKNQNAESFTELHENLMGFNFQSYEREKIEKRDVLPKSVTENLPSDQTFGRIKAGKYESYDTLRKTLVILAFYDFYSAAGENIHVIQNLMDFYEETDQRLLDCGFTPLYVRNPFDGLIIACARDSCPIHRFYNLNDLRFREE